MKEFKYTLAWSGIFLTMLLSSKAYSQYQKDSLMNNKEGMPNSQIKILIAPTLFQGAKLSHQKQEILQSNLSPSYDFGIEYYHHIKNNIGVNIGLHWGQIPEHYKFEVIVPEFYNLYERKMYTNSRDFISQFIYIPLSIDKKIQLQKKETFMSLSGGISINYIHPFISTYTATYSLDSTNSFLNGKEFFKSIISNEYQKWFLSYFVKVGISRQFKKSASTFEVNLKINYTPRLIGKGTYEFSNINEESYGNVGLRLNYIGIEFVYGLTLSKKPKYKSEDMNTFANKKYR